MCLCVDVVGWVRATTTPTWGSQRTSCKSCPSPPPYRSWDSRSCLLNHLAGSAPHFLMMKQNRELPGIKYSLSLLINLQAWRCCSVGRELAWYTQSLECLPCHWINQAWWFMPVFPALLRARQKNRKSKVILGRKASLGYKKPCSQYYLIYT